MRIGERKSTFTRGGYESTKEKKREVSSMLWSVGSRWLDLGVDDINHSRLLLYCRTDAEFPPVIGF